MFKKLGLSIRFKKAIKKAEKNINAVPYTEAKNFGILVKDFSKNREAVQYFVNQLRNEGKVVQVLNFESGDIPGSSEDILNFTKKDIDWKGKIKSEECNKFLNSKFDFLFSLHTSTFLPIEKIIAQANAKCKVGHFNSEKLELFDIMINNTSEDINKSSLEMLNFTKLI